MDEEDIPVFRELNEVQSIVGTLVENIYNDDAYQEYLNELDASDVKNSAKKVANIKNTCSTIRAFNNVNNPLFLAHDIGVIIGATNVNQMIKNYTDSEKMTGHILDHKGRNVKKTFLTRHGVYRILFNNKTKLAEVFRGFIYKLVDHMVYYENDKLRDIIKQYASENKDLINESILELNENLSKYKELYEEEKQECHRLETAQVYSEMYIKQLKIDKDNILDKLDDRRYGEDADEISLALDILKKKFLKEFTISLVNPILLDDVFDKSKKKITPRHETIIYDNYKSNYDFLVKSFEKNKKINTEDILYISLSYGTPDKGDKVDKVETDNKDYVHVASDYVMDKKKFSELLDILKTDCDTYQLPKSKKISTIIYKTTIEYIQLVARNILVQS